MMGELRQNRFPRAAPTKLRAGSPLRRPVILHDAPMPALAGRVGKPIAIVWMLSVPPRE